VRARGDDVLLPDNRGERARPPFSGKHLVRHGGNSIRPTRSGPVR
jgi:hypothetical protein